MVFSQKEELIEVKGRGSEDRVSKASTMFWNLWLIRKRRGAIGGHGEVSEPHVSLAGLY